MVPAGSLWMHLSGLPSERYVALAAMIHRFHYLKYALAILLGFIGSTRFVADFLLGGEKFPPQFSLAITIGLILAGIVHSLWKTKGGEAVSGE